MRTAHKVWSGIAAGVFCLVAISDLSSSPTTAASAPAAATAPAPASSAPTSVAAPAPTRAAAPTVTVTEVIDGDTLLVGGRRIGVLGIDSCPASTYGGKQATSLAESLVEGRDVTLRAEPGVEKDRAGRLLRYVDLPYGSDFGGSMVAYDHTGAVENGADPSYLAGLRDADPNGRTCSQPAPTSSSGNYDDDGSIDLPTPGDQGLPDGALTGGYCKRKWWC
ncbi:thermonuclease family protein [Actinomycetospora atypica]|uniref:Thermonuclease family protein n=1 Tax=Actinomycetospora atypica TaxID=1290095 RepID=A0ABV9YFS1_9PSEU